MGLRFRALISAGILTLGLAATATAAGTVEFHAEADREAMAQDESVSIKMTVEAEGSTPVDAPTFVQTVRRAKQDANFPCVAVSPMPMAHFADPADTLAFALYGKSPFSVYGNPEADALIEKAGETVNDDARANYIRAAFKIIHADIPSFTIWNQVEVYSMKKAYTFTPTRKGVPMFQLWNVARA